MAKSSTFRLTLPTSKPVEVYTVQLANGVIVTRTLDELTPHPLNAIGKHGDR